MSCYPVICRMFVGCLLASALSGELMAQLVDPLPALPQGNVILHLERFASGLPVEREFVTPVFTQQVGPTDLATVPGSDGIMVVTNYGGKAFVIDGQGQLMPEPLLDLGNAKSPSYNPRFEIGDAHGLTTMAFHPNFAKADKPGFRKFYVLEPETSGSGTPDFSRSIRVDKTHDEVLYEYTLPEANGWVCRAECEATKRPLFRVLQPGWHHNLGDLLFGSDGLLYISSGDGSTAGTLPPIMSDNSQLLNNIFGKVLRIDPLGNNSANGRYGIPEDNPFRDSDGPNVDEIYAYGLRNPFRIEFDTATGDLYASETGELKVESVERIQAGSNHGWNMMEGRFVYDRFTRAIYEDTDLDRSGRGDTAENWGFEDPVFQYDRSNGIAVVGAVPYAGEFVPGLQGQILFGDFSGKLFYGDPKTGLAYAATLDGQSAAVPWNVHSVNRGADGEIYLLGIEQVGADQLDGVIIKIHATAALDGDFDRNGQLNARDLDFMSQSIREGELEKLFDVNGDGVTSELDRLTWIYGLKKSQFGDANFDGQFTSTDLLQIFVAGHFEEGETLAAGWEDGDFNGDGRFGTADLVAALAAGYESDAEANRTEAIPEPGTFGLLLILSAGITRSAGITGIRPRRARQCLRSKVRGTGE